MTDHGDYDRRDRDRDRKRDERAAKRDIEIPAVLNVRRRRKALRDIYYFLPTYFPETFYAPFTSDHREIVGSMLHLAHHGGDQCIAAPRGCGKGTLMETAAGVYAIVSGLLKFPLLVSATGPDAAGILDSIKLHYESSVSLAEDFPEVCAPILALEGNAARARGQTFKGERTRIIWGQKFLVFPAIPGSKASGAVIETRGLDSAIRGVRRNGHRPDLAVIDDPDTEESASSEVLGEKREKVIERGIGGLAGQGRKIARLMLCTTMTRTCLAWKYSDPQAKPSWSGKRFALMLSEPDDMALWERYIEIRQEAQKSGDKLALAARDFYIANRVAMDKGAKVSDDHRAVAELVDDDGNRVQLSTLQYCFDFIADKGWEAFRTEFQNDPPEDDDTEQTGLDVAIVQNRLNGYAHKVVPRNAQCLTAFVDLGVTSHCHWSVVAWLPQATGCVIDYGVEIVHQSKVLGDTVALSNALQARHEAWQAEPYVDEDGVIRDIQIIAIDNGNGAWEADMWAKVQSLGKPWRCMKGIGNSINAPKWSNLKRTKTRKPGDHWLESNIGARRWLIESDADYWKRWVHERFASDHFTDTGQLRAGSMTLWGESKSDAREHKQFAASICSEREERTWDKKRGWVTKWKVGRNNHDLDTVYGNAVLGSMCGASLSPPRPRPKVVSDWFERQMRKEAK